MFRKSLGDLLATNHRKNSPKKKQSENSVKRRLKKKRMN